MQSGNRVRSAKSHSSCMALTNMADHHQFLVFKSSGDCTNGGSYSGLIVPCARLHRSVEAHYSHSKERPRFLFSSPARTPSSFQATAYLPREQRKAQSILRCVFDLVQIFERQYQLWLAWIHRVPHPIGSSFLSVLRHPPESAHSSSSTQPLGKRNHSL